MSDLTRGLRIMGWALEGGNALMAADCFRAADALDAAEAELARLEHQLQQAEEATTAAYKDAETAEARSADLQTKLAAIRTHCQDNLAARSMGDYENGYDGACLDILDILEAQ